MSNAKPQDQQLIDESSIVSPPPPPEKKDRLEAGEFAQSTPLAAWLSLHVQVQVSMVSWLIGQ